MRTDAVMTSRLCQLTIREVGELAETLGVEPHTLFTDALSAAVA